MSEFGAFGVTSPITASFEFSNPVTNLGFSLDHVSAQGTTYDDLFTLYVYDDSGVLMSSADVIAGLSGITHHTVTVNADGSVSVEGEGLSGDNVWVSLAGPVSQIDIVFEAGPDGTQSGGAGISDFTFAIPPEVVCFARGTLIRTVNGDVPVERLRRGDHLETHESGPQQILWIGSKLLTADDIANRPRHCPVRIRRGALGEGRPERDLIVSPQHRMLIRSKISMRMFSNTEVLIAAKHLTAIPDIEIAGDIAGVEYFHLMLGQHCIIFAEAASTESLLPGPQALRTLAPETIQEISEIFPEILQPEFKVNPVRYSPAGNRARKFAERVSGNRKWLYQTDCSV